MEVIVTTKEDLKEMVREAVVQGFSQAVPPDLMAPDSRGVRRILCRSCAVNDRRKQRP